MKHARGEVEPPPKRNRLSAFIAVEEVPVIAAAVATAIGMASRKFVLTLMLVIVFAAVAMPAVVAMVEEQLQKQE